MADTIQEQIDESARGPKRAKGDGVEVEQHSLRDQIEADRYLASKTAASSGFLGIRVCQIKPPGAV